MESQDLELIEKHRGTNEALDRLYEEHLKLDAEAEELESRRVLLDDDRKRLNVLKKLKLEGRDRMEEILQTLR